MIRQCSVCVLFLSNNWRKMSALPSSVKIKNNYNKNEFKKKITADAICLLSSAGQSNHSIECATMSGRCPFGYQDPRRETTYIRQIKQHTSLSPLGSQLSRKERERGYSE